MLGKVSKSFRFEVDLYEDFKRFVGVAGCTVTGAFEHFMAGRVERGSLVFAEHGVGGLCLFRSKLCTSKLTRGFGLLRLMMFK